MAWAAIGGAVAGAVVTSSMNKGGGGNGGATTTESKTPWAPAQPWIMSNLQTGQNLQNYYQQNPFNAVQQGAYQNLFAGNDYINQMVPSLLGQFSQQQGFDRSNPHAKPMAMQFPTAPTMPAMYGLLGVSPSNTGAAGMNRMQNPFAGGGLLPAAPAAAAPSGPVAAPGSLVNYGSGNPYATFDPSSGGG